MREMMSPPSEFILEWNSMQATPSFKSTSDAPAFRFTASFDFLATATDHTPAGTCRGLYSCVAISKKALPEFAEGESLYQDFLPEASSFSTFPTTGLPSFFMRATVRSTPAASHNSNGPSSQLKPSRMPRSISTMLSEISGTRFAEEVQSSGKAVHRNKLALSCFCGCPSRPSETRMRATVSWLSLPISRAAKFAWCGGGYSSVFQSRARRSSSLPLSPDFSLGEDARPTTFL